MLCLVCCGREKYGPFIALTPNIDWWVKRSLYPGTRGEKVSKLRSCQYVIFCLSNAQKSSPSTEIQLYNIVHICFVCTLHICLLYTVWNKVMFVKSRGPYQLTAHWNPLLDTTVRGTMWNQLLIISDLFFQRHCKMICRGLANLWRAGLARPHCKLLFPFLFHFSLYFKLHFHGSC